MTREQLTHLVEQGSLSYLDLHFAGYMEKLAGCNQAETLLAAALASASSRQGHICLDLSLIAGRPLLEEQGGSGLLQSPPAAEWREKLLATSVVGRPGEYRPLILDDRSRLYLYRYWNYQQKLAQLIRERVAAPHEAIDFNHLGQALGRLFPSDGDAVIDWQKIAALSAVRARFTVISGGPGTGKTTTVARILALLVEHAAGGRPHIALTAPTGKAAARLQEAIKYVKGQLDCRPEVMEAIPEAASTIHRLLGVIPGSPYFRHNEANLLPVDVVVVDEASMVDLALMSKLVQALPLSSRLILLGDKDQLASVEAGAVLGDICDTGRQHGYSGTFSDQLCKVTGYRLDPGADERTASASRVSDCIVHLQKSYRFGAESGIGVLSRAVNGGDGSEVLSILRSGSYCNIQWKKLPPPQALASFIKSSVSEGFRGYLNCADRLEIFRLFDRFRVLCAVREGPFGVVALNRLVERILAAQGLIEPKKKWYAGRPVLVMANDYNLRLFNGDVGIVLPDPDNGNDLRVFFPGPEGTLRKLHPTRLPEHETVFAMTVHKSQGSEFDRVLLVLPEKDVPVLTRELIYTAVTRAREQIEICGLEAVLQSAVSRRIERMSGLRDALWSE